MESRGLQMEDLLVLDLLVNLGPLSKWQLLNFKLKCQGLTVEKPDEAVRQLQVKGLVMVETKQQTESFMIPHEKLEEVRSLVTTFLDERGITVEALLKETEKDHIGVLRILGAQTEFEGKLQIIFSDYFGDPQSLGLCERLTNAGFFFYSSWSSRKHSYQTYYFRRMPFNVSEVLEQFIVRKLNLRGLDLSTEWRILVVAIYAEAPLRLDELRSCFPDLTSDEISEILKKLEARGVISRQPNGMHITLPARDLVKNYFLFNMYQAFKSTLAMNLRKRISERLSNIYLLGLVRKVVTATAESVAPFTTVRRSLLKGIPEDDLREAAKLGIVFVTSSDVIIAYEVLTELEDILRLALREETFATIPAGEQYAAMSVWRRLFGECTDYIKIQDEWVNEETLSIAQSYAPPNLDVTILCSLEGARDADIEEMRERIRSLGYSRKIDLKLVGYEATRKAPFHERYIISKDVCYMLSQSIKDVGKSKSASIVAISKDRKEGLVERAFDYWLETPREKLKQLGIVRISFDEWLDSRK